MLPASREGTVREGDHFRFGHSGRDVPAHAPADDTPLRLVFEPGPTPGLVLARAALGRSAMQSDTPGMGSAGDPRVGGQPPLVRESQALAFANAFFNSP